MKESYLKENEIFEFEDTQNYKHIVENSNFAVLLTSPDGIIYSANDEAYRMFGRTEKVKENKKGFKDMYRIISYVEDIFKLRFIFPFRGIFVVLFGSSAFKECTIVRSQYV